MDDAAYPCAGDFAHTMCGGGFGMRAAAWCAEDEALQDDNIDQRTDETRACADTDEVATFR